MNKKLLPLLTLISFLGYLTSCNGILDNLKVETEISLPIGSSTISSTDIIENIGSIGSQLSTNEDSVLTYSVSSNYTVIDNSNFATLFSIPVQSTDFLFPIPDLSTLPIVIDTSIAIDTTTTVLLTMPNNEVLDTVVFSNSTISIAIDENLISSLGLENTLITIKQITDLNGNAIVLEPNKPLLLDNNYTLIPLNTSNITNGLELQLTSNINLSQYTAATGLSSTFNFEINNIISVTRELGTNSISNTEVEFTADNTLTDFLSDLDNLYFADPQISLEFDYGFETAAIISIDSFSISGTQIELKDSCSKLYIAPNATTIITISNASTTSGDQLSKLINSNFSNFSLTLSAIVNPSATEVALAGNAPSSYTQAQNYKIESTDKIDLDYKFTIPFDINVQGLSFEESMSLDLSDSDTDSFDVEQLALGFSTENALPFDITIQAKLGDNYIFENSITIPASLNTNSLNITPSVNSGADMIIAQIKQEYANELINSNNSLIFELSLSSKDNSTVKLYNSSYLSLNLLIGTQLSFALNN